ncbi:unnamed protein product [Rotaria sp. Silwood2]|nr:unnamed protein product [Rotaria sp. Silwood2]CAF2811882.1 unnamed protein product [Rotaria sp. Silwood2]CAF2977878.1 unnamed protein product [Rotaria sp. Silwood2]CAF3071305.1 unnamed protein product [Rotaria sp. Silwood2]CAF3868435.1 unnamed protein product [Rotaria sp. Silwood2]
MHLTYLEGHYHWRLTKLMIPGILPLLYLYENHYSTYPNELWMIFPKDLRNLNDILEQYPSSIDFKQALKILIHTAETLNAYHHYDLAHGNLKSSYILIDDNKDTSFLADWGPILSNDISIIEDCHRATEQRVNKDIQDFGHIGLQITEAIKEKTNSIRDFKQLMKKCTDISYHSRMSAHDLCSALNSIYNSI